MANLYTHLLPEVLINEDITDCRKELMVSSVLFLELFKNCFLMLQKTVHPHTLSP
jgi:hypothetical protein